MTRKLVNNFHVEQGKAEETAKMGMMVAWSFLDGSIMSMPVWAFERMRKSISHFFDKLMGTVPEDKSVYEEEPKRNWKHLLGARAATFSLVFPTAVILDKMKWNKKLFYDTGGAIGESKPIQKLFPKLAQKTVVNDKGSSLPFLKALGEISAFEAFYTSLCTFGLWLGAKIFAGRKKAADENNINAPVQNAAPATSNNANTNISQSVIHEPGMTDNKEAYAAYGNMQRTKPVEKQPEKFSERQHGDQVQQGSAPMSM